MGIPHPHFFPQPITLLNTYKKREISFFLRMWGKWEGPHGCEEKGVFVPLVEGLWEIPPHVWKGVIFRAIHECYTLSGARQ
jgi:hypothetical protein